MMPALVVGAIAIAAAAAGGFFAGQRWTQGAWDAAELDRITAEAQRARDRLAVAQAESAGHEATRAAIAAELRKTNAALSVALRTPISCAGAAPLELGDYVLLAGLLDGVRDPAGVLEPLDRAAGEPGQDVRSGTANSAEGR